MTDWLAAADAYLYSLGSIGVEDALCDACLSGRVPAALAGSLEIDCAFSQRRAEPDGASSEIYLGTLTLAGLRYGFECRLFVDADGSYFVSDIARFEPVEWRTVMRVA
jgi:hypothetical protein